MSHLEVQTRPLYRCYGTHMSSVHSLRLFLFPRAQARSRSLTTFARLHPLVVPRLITYLTPIYHQITQASSILSCGAAQVPDRISQVVDERKSSEKRVSDLASHLVLTAAKESLPSETRANEKGTSAHVHRNDGPLVFLTTIASEFVNLYTASDYASK